MNHTVVAGYVSGGDRCSVLKFTCGAVAQDKKTYDITAHVLKKKTVPTIVVNTINLGILLIQSRVIGGSELSIVKMHEVWIEKSHHLIEKTREGKIEYIVVALQNVTDRQQDSDAASTAACRTSILKIADGEVMVYGMLRRGESKVVDIAGVCTVHI
ncbi:hypothetical protein F5884DRAFT_142684 [Xylogone sp. PMI_703]|nr:hypothetical protein F5884DRAFT_142684 [Xylogone sp. PMI_703]